MSHISLVNHPVSYLEKKWRHHQYRTGQMPEQTIIGTVGDVKFVFDTSFGPHIKKMYYETYEFDVREAMRKYLRPGGIFIDVGANIGFLTATAANLVGKRGQVHSFEPVQEYFDYLQKIANLNPDYNIVVNNTALGQARYQACIVLHKFNIGGGSIVPGFISEKDRGEAFNIAVQRLDEYLEKWNLSNISLIKIDTEGFELPVLLGTSGFFEAHKTDLSPVIVEIAPRAFSLMDRSLNELDDFMSSYGYKAYEICGQHRLNVTQIGKTTNVLFKA